MVLFGGSILCGGDVLAKAMRSSIAKKFIIVGGEGHTTETLRMKMRRCYPQLQTAGLAEAQIFAAYLKCKYGLTPDFLECESTNCGNNITNLLQLLSKHHIAHRSMILCQDATMQMRMDAGMRKHCPSQTVIINYAAYAATVMFKEGRLTYAENIWGMWDMDRYITLLMSEIIRLTDDAGGYGPNGTKFISHVQVPDTVRMSFNALQVAYGGMVRKGNPMYASKE